MKKIITTVLAIALVACMGIGANAQTITSSEEGSNASSANVNAKYVPSQPAYDCVSVDVEWGSMTFTYTQGEKTWNPTTHKDDIEAGTWSADGNTVTVTNHSNICVVGTLEYNADSAYSAVEGSFYKSDDYNPDSQFTGFFLDAADETGASTDIAYFMIDNGTVNSTVGNGTKIGTITLTLTGDDD